MYSIEMQIKEKHNFLRTDKKLYLYILIALLTSFCHPLEYYKILFLSGNNYLIILQ